MRTTLDLDDDVLKSVRPLAQKRGVSIGKLISELARQSLAAQNPQNVRNGVLLFTPKAGAARPDLRLVNELRDAD
jgi:hypothetical protein